MVDEEKLLELRATNRRAADVQVELKILQLRAALFERRPGLPTGPAESAQAPDGPRRFGLPTASRAELNIGRLRDAMSSHGALHVRGLLDQQRVDQMKSVVDSALDAQEAACSGAFPPGSSPWFHPSEWIPEASRQWVRSTGAVLAIDSPRGIYQLIETYYDEGLDRLVTEFFGERPALSAEKTTLRRVAPIPEPAGWHQDGQFLGANIRSLNVWIALSDCGVDAPGLELVPTRLNYIVQTGTAGAPLDWCVSQSHVEKEFAGTLICPQFNAGDAMLFDHFLLHRTSRSAGMTRTRYAIESWFFAPSAYPPSGQTGLYV